MVSEHVALPGPEDERKRSDTRAGEAGNGLWKMESHGAGGFGLELNTREALIKAGDSREGKTEFFKD